MAHSTGPGGQCTGELAGGVTHLGLSLAGRGHWAVRIRRLMRCRGGEGRRREERMVRLSVNTSRGVGVLMDLKRKYYRPPSHRSHQHFS